MIKKNFIKFKRGQTALELAAFGAIIIFIIGAIVRTALTTGYQQNQTLKAMRTAMSKSFLYSEGVTGSNPDGEASRNIASVLVVEDRLTADATKFAPTDRIPLIMVSGGAHSRNLLMPINSPDEYYHLSILDLYVNGKHFPLRMAGFKTMCFEKNQNACNPKDEWLDYNVHPGYWDDTCGGAVPVSPGSGCPQFFVRIVNSIFESRWCNDIQGPGTIACDKNLNGKKRFDLNLKWTNPPVGTGQGDDPVDGVPPGQITIDPGAPLANPPIFPTVGYPRLNFSWQWYAIHGSTGSLPNGFEGITIKKDSQINTQADFDGDLEEETMIQILTAHGSVIARAVVIDNQSGDLDFSRAGQPGAPQVGLLPDTSITTETHPGHSLKIEEGKLYDATNQFVRSVQKKDTIDTITRQLRLTRNTGRFCNPIDSGNIGDTSVNHAKIFEKDTNDDGIADAPPNIPNPEDNPVEWCAATDGECTDTSLGGHSTQTCMSLQTNTIFIRSKPIDKRGRKWVTNINKDDYVDFVVPNKNINGTYDF